MIEKKEWVVTFEGRKFLGIDRLGFDAKGQFLVDLFPLPPPKPRGGYFTMPPVSPLEWRREHGQSEKLGYHDAGDAFVLLDEYGTPYRFETNREAIDQLIVEAAANDIPRRWSPVSEKEKHG